MKIISLLLKKSAPSAMTKNMEILLIAKGDTIRIPSISLIYGATLRHFAPKIYQKILLISLLNHCKLSTRKDKPKRMLF